ncbi:MAG: hypothetical protein A4S09_08215 [Proteobacteria bacterium SG_bin7]|nr:MAG: hypothetical protein A4S09_08215 [Proteobacteria bacterium SG_bin7]
MNLLPLSFFVLVLVFVFGAFTPVRALELSPMEMDFTTTGNNSSHVFTVENKFSKDIAVELKIYKRRINLKGEESRDDTNDFLIFPRQIKLAPGQKKPVRVSWQGPTEVKKEIPYRLVLEQLPIDFKKKENQGQKIDIDFLLKYVASLYVLSEPAKSEIVIENLEKRKSRLHFILKNNGSKHLVVSKFVLIGGSGEIPLVDTSLRQVLGRNILAESALEFDLPWPSELQAQHLELVKVHVE